MRLGTETDAVNTNNNAVSTELAPFDMGQAKAIVLEKANADKAEILALTNKLDLTDSNSIVTFGKEAADEISKCSDIILNNVEMDKITGAGNLIKTLTNIMKKFDVNELSEEKKGFLSRLVTSAKKELEKILDKYNTMGGEVDKIYVELKKYETDIGTSNESLENLFNTNMEYYQLLTKYILAGEEGCRLIDAEIDRVQGLFNETQDGQYQMQLQNLDMGKQVLAQRVQDLRIAENVALQTIPMIKTMQFSNMNLARKINSAFIITLPIFKQNLAQAVLLKRQKIQSDALAALDEKTNEMLLKNAENTVDSAKMTTKLASTSAVRVETLEKTWNIIMTGIEETARIRDDASRKREEDKVRLEAIKSEYKQKMLNAN